MSYTPLQDPVFTGNPRVPTASPGDNDTTASSTAFVTAAITAAAAGYVHLAGTETITGAKTFSSDVTLSGVKALYLGMASGTSVIFNSDVTGDSAKRLSVDASGKHSWGSGSGAADVTLERVAADTLQLGSGDQIRVLQDPVNANDLARKGYVDAVASGLDLKASSRAATTGALPSYTNTALTLTGSVNGALPAQDGVTLIAGDRLLVKNEAGGNLKYNGIYDVTVVGSAGTKYVLTRSSDSDGAPTNEVTTGMFTFVEEGTTLAGTGWVLTTANPITVDTTGLTFTQFSATSNVTTLDSLTDVDTTGVVDGALLRYESSGTQWNDTINLLFTDADQLQVKSNGSTGGIALGTAADANLYRSAAGVLKTDGSVNVNANTLIGSTGAVTLSAGVSQLDFTALTAASTVAARTKVSGDANYRLQLQADGKLLWGDGTATTDLNLYRSAAGVLKTDNAFNVNGNTNIASTGAVTLSAGASMLDFTALTAVTTVAARTKVSGDAAYRYQAQADGKLLWGDGTSAADTNIYRAAADSLKTDDAFTVALKFTAQAAINQAVTTKSANYTVSLTADNIIFVDTNAAAGAVTITLPATHTAGDTVQVKDIGGQAETKNIIVDPADADTVDGLSTFTINVNYFAASFVSNGTNWFVL